MVKDWETGLHCTHHNRKVGQKKFPGPLRQFAQAKIFTGRYGFLLYPVIDRGHKEDQIFYTRFNPKFMDACFLEGYPVSVNRLIWVPFSERGGESHAEIKLFHLAPRTDPPIYKYRKEVYTYDKETCIHVPGTGYMPEPLRPRSRGGK